MQALKECRACGAQQLRSVLDLGDLPLANRLRRREELELSEKRYPLEVARCLACTLLQLVYSVPPTELFSEYVYFSSFSDDYLRHSRNLAERLIAERELDHGSQVVEIASNDGYLLQYYQAHGIPVLGIEPARNVADVAERQRGIRTIVEFFDETLASRLSRGGVRADVVHANNVLAHVPDPRGFAAGIGEILVDGGVAVVEVPWARDLLAGLEFDTIYHEHLSYFSVTALGALFKGAGLTVEKVETIPVHGGSLRLFVGRGETDGSLERLAEEERTAGLGSDETYARFAGRVTELKRNLAETVRALRRDGRSVAAYGASAKGSTLLNYVGLGLEEIGFVADRSTAKQGLYTPGPAIPIVSAEELLERRPDYTLLLTWNFADEILRQQSEYRKQGGRFIIPIPEPRIV